MDGRSFYFILMGVGVAIIAGQRVLGWGVIALLLGLVVILIGFFGTVVTTDQNDPGQSRRSPFDARRGR